MLVNTNFNYFHVSFCSLTYFRYMLHGFLIKAGDGDNNGSQKCADFAVF